VYRRLQEELELALEKLNRADAYAASLERYIGALEGRDKIRLETIMDLKEELKRCKEGDTT
jgi:hypothetical protein